MMVVEKYFIAKRDTRARVCVGCVRNCILKPYDRAGAKGCYDDLMTGVLESLRCTAGGSGDAFRGAYDSLTTLRTAGSDYTTRRPRMRERVIQIRARARRASSTSGKSSMR